MIYYRSDKTNEQLNAEIAQHLGVEPQINYAGDLNEAIKLAAIDTSMSSNMSRINLRPSTGGWQASVYTDAPVHGDFVGKDEQPARACCLAWLAWRDRYQIAMQGL